MVSGALGKISIDCAYLSDGPLPTNLIKHLRDSRSTLNWLLIQMMSTDANDLIEAQANLLLWRTCM
jgi:hypothetical protein